MRQSAAPQEITGKIVAVSDCATVTIPTHGQTPVKIRLEGIDAPGKKQAFGNRSKLALSTRIWNGETGLGVERKRNAVPCMHSVVSKAPPARAMRKRNAVPCMHSVGFLSRRTLRHSCAHADVIEHQACNGGRHLMDTLARIQSAGGEGLVIRRNIGTGYATGRQRDALKVKSVPHVFSAGLAKGKYYARGVRAAV